MRPLPIGLLFGALLAGSVMLDNPLSLAAYQEIVKRLGPIDIAFLPFAGASSYPTCFEWDRATIEEKGRQKKAEYSQGNKNASHRGVPLCWMNQQQFALDAADQTIFATNEPLMGRSPTLSDENGLEV